jgi:uncharacterized repeat protein (TIGR03837 family)
MGNPTSGKWRADMRIDIFCEVCDNFGDAGVCWRLARHLANERGCDIRLWIDKPDVLQRICRNLNPDLPVQHVCQVTVCRWPENLESQTIGQIPDVVIEGFGTRLPEAYCEMMTKRAVAPVWVNLEYLSAEPWVEGMHKMPSPHPRLPLTKYFFFPGFTAQTGGLIREDRLIETANAFKEDKAKRNDFLSSLGVDASGFTRIVSLFCYPIAPVETLLKAFSILDIPVLCLVPEGVAVDQVTRFLGAIPVVGKLYRKGNLGLQVIPMMEQAQYDLLLFSCDLNFVRGEDSFVRAQWAGKPFAWQIYPQQEDAHFEKLDAFMHLYAQGLVPEDATTLRTFVDAWNGRKGAKSVSEALLSFMALWQKLAQHSLFWRQKLTQQDDLGTALVRFIESLR